MVKLIRIPVLWFIIFAVLSFCGNLFANSESRSDIQKVINASLKLARAFETKNLKLLRQLVDPRIGMYFGYSSGVYCSIGQHFPLKSNFLPKPPWDEFWNNYFQDGGKLIRKGVKVVKLNKKVPNFDCESYPKLWASLYTKNVAQSFKKELLPMCGYDEVIYKKHLKEFQKAAPLYHIHIIADGGDFLEIWFTKHRGKIYISLITHCLACDA